MLEEYYVLIALCPIALCVLVEYCTILHMDTVDYAKFCIMPRCTNCVALPCKELVFCTGEHCFAIFATIYLFSSDHSLKANISDKKTLMVAF